MLAELIKLVISTIKDPKSVAVKIMTVTFPDKVLWALVVLVVIISVLLSELANWLLSFGSFRQGFVLFNSPFLATSVLSLMMMGLMMGEMGVVNQSLPRQATSTSSHWRGGAPRRRCHQRDFRCPGSI